MIKLNNLWSTLYTQGTTYGTFLETKRCFLKVNKWFLCSPCRRCKSENVNRISLKACFFGNHYWLCHTLHCVHLDSNMCRCSYNDSMREKVSFQNICKNAMNIIVKRRRCYFIKPVARPVFQGWQIFTGGITWCKI